MYWYKYHTTDLSALAGIIVGFLYLMIGPWFEMQRQQLSVTWRANLYLNKSPFIFPTGSCSIWAWDFILTGIFISSPHLAYIHLFSPCGLSDCVFIH